MKVEDRRKEGVPVTISLDNLEPGTIIFIKNRYLILAGASLSSTDRLFSNSEDIDIAVDLETGEVVEPPDEVFPIQILNNIKLVVE